MATHATTHILALDNLGVAQLGEDAPSPRASLGVGRTLAVSKATADRLVLQRKACIITAAEAKAYEDRARGAPAIPEGMKAGSKEHAALLATAEASKIAVDPTPSTTSPEALKEKVTDADRLATAAEEQVEATAAAEAKADARAAPRKK